MSTTDLSQTWATCIITGPGLACNDTESFFNEGVLCSSPDETRRQTANLYYAYAVDTVTNMMGGSKVPNSVVIVIRTDN
jgi:hypothetical protein